MISLSSLQTSSGTPVIFGDSGIDNRVDLYTNLHYDLDHYHHILAKARRSLREMAYLARASSILKWRTQLQDKDKESALARSITAGGGRQDRCLMDMSHGWVYCIIIGSIFWILLVKFRPDVTRSLMLIARTRALPLYYIPRISSSVTSAIP
jgi:hypothetical protein